MIPLRTTAWPATVTVSGTSSRSAEARSSPASSCGVATRPRSKRTATLFAETTSTAAVVETVVLERGTDSATALTALVIPVRLSVAMVCVTSPTVTKGSLPSASKGTSSLEEV